jgi:D-sedoheptulose 7-phosphate isomerase
MKTYELRDESTMKLTTWEVTSDNGSSGLAGTQLSEVATVGCRLETSASFHLSKVAELVGQVSPRAVAEISHLLNRTRLSSGTVYTMGNGGSAATALHMTNDFSTVHERARAPRALRTNCLNGNVSLFSALANDFGYENVFVRQLEGLVSEGDVVVGISASGNSPNCVNGMMYARERGATTVGLLGFDGGAMKDLCDYSVHVPCYDYRLVEDVHMAVSHALTSCLSHALEEGP